jgi:hypothetical protein
MKWFKHSASANQDAKLKRVRMKYGMEGYGLYWYCIELVASEVEQNKLTFELEHDAEIISFDTGIHYERVNEMMAYMVDLELFEDSSGTITCMKLAKRADEYTAKYLKTKLEIINSVHSPDSVPTISSPKERKGKEKRLKESKQVISPEHECSEPVEIERTIITMKYKSGDYALTETEYEKHKKAYPNINLITEYEKMALWCEQNPKQRKTKAGMPRFISGWLSRINPNQLEDYSFIPINDIAREYKRLLSTHTGYYPELLNDRIKSDIAKRWNASEKAQSVNWWVQFFSAIKNKIQDIEPQFMPSKYKLDKLVGFDFESVINEL